MVIRNTDGVRLERTSYRDDSLNTRMQTWGDGFISIDVAQDRVNDSISARHRNWGYDCPVTNIDCLMCEYDHKVPMAVIEYKGRAPMQEDRRSANVQVIATLATMAGLPALLVYYDNVAWTFRVEPINPSAQDWLKRTNVLAGETLSERRFVEFLYRVRHKFLPEQIKQTLRDIAGVESDHITVN